MKEKEFERRLDKKIQGHAKIMSDEKRKKIHIDYAKNHSQNELFGVYRGNERINETFNKDHARKRVNEK